jgi:hypothetical protein
VQLLEQHVACAAVEAAVVPCQDAAFFGQGIHPTCARLLEKGENKKGDRCR